MMKTKDRCKQFIENISDTTERLITGHQFNRLPEDTVQTSLKNILRMCDYLQDSLDQED